MTTSFRSRKPGGTPFGGQFAPGTRAESAVALRPSSADGRQDRDPLRARNCPQGHVESFTRPTGSLADIDPKARAALLNATAPTVKNPDSMYPVVIGPRYDREMRRTSAEVAKLLRVDLRAAQASGALPRSAVFSVRSESFAGGQSVRVEIRNLPDREILDDHPDFPYRLSPAARELERTVRRVANAYYRDASDRASDVYDVHYYAQVTIETEAGSRTRRHLDAESRAARRNTNGKG